MSRAGNKLTELKKRSRERSRVLDQVRAALPPELAAAVVSAGLEKGRLTIGVVGSVWASRLRYAMEHVRNQLDPAGTAVTSVRIRVVPPPAI